MRCRWAGSAQGSRSYANDITLWPPWGHINFATRCFVKLRQLFLRTQTNVLWVAAVALWFRRRPEPGVLFHSDRGSQYASHAYQARLATCGMRGSMSRKGNCWGNAPTESFFNSLKNERVHGVRYATRDEAAR